jgi:hypothetical protein
MTKISTTGVQIVLETLKIPLAEIIPDQWDATHLIEGTLKMKVRSGRIVVGAIGLELALIIVLVPLLSRVQMSILLPLSAVVVSVFGFAWGWWVVRRIQGWYVFHATATGILATLMYLALCLMNPQGGIRSVVAMYGPFFFVSGNLLRILACAAGGYLYQVRKKG